MTKNLIGAISLALTVSAVLISPVYSKDSSKTETTPRKTAQESSLPKITRADLSAKLGKVTLVDALSAASFGRSHIKGSVSLPYDEVEKNASKVLPSKDAEIVVYCMNVKCHASDKVADELSKLGYKHVSIYREGLQDWVASGLAAEGTSPSEPIPPKKTAEAK